MFLLCLSPHPVVFLPISFTCIFTQVIVLLCLFSCPVLILNSQHSAVLISDWFFSTSSSVLNSSFPPLFLLLSYHLQVTIFHGIGSLPETNRQTKTFVYINVLFQILTGSDHDTIEEYGR